MFYVLCLLKALAVCFMAVLDHYRGTRPASRPGGTAKIPKVFKLIACAGTLGLITGLTGLPLLGFIILGSIGYTIGFGGPLGAVLGRHNNPSRLHYWQFGYFKKNMKAAMFLRGAIAGILLLPLAYFNAQILLYPITFGLAYLIAPLLSQDWEEQEYIRGFLIGLACL